VSSFRGIGGPTSRFSGDTSIQNHPLRLRRGRREMDRVQLVGLQSWVAGEKFRRGYHHARYFLVIFYKILILLTKKPGMAGTRSVEKYGKFQGFKV
jgi:hypothetical protein